MEHIFKPGDKAYWIKNGWIDLIENPERDSSLYPLRDKESRGTFTVEGQRHARGGDIVLLPLNPYDPCDPNNPPEFRYPFMLNGKPVFEGSELHHLGYRKTSVVTALFLEDGKQWCGLKNTSVGELSPKNFCWPDELPVKKKVADWMCAVIKLSGEIELNYEKGMTEEDVKRVYGVYGSHIQMIPGTEREVEL